MKQQLSEALAEAEYRIEQGGLISPPYVDRTLFTLVDTARLVERLLPGECENCGGTGIAGVHRHIKQSTGEHLGDQDVPCGFCDNGQVWDEGIVEVVADVLIERRVTHKDQLRTFTDAVATCREDARAVLSALVELLTEKSPSELEWLAARGKGGGH